MGGTSARQAIRQQWGWRRKNYTFYWYKEKKPYYSLRWNVGRVVANISEDMAIFSYQLHTNSLFAAAVFTIILTGVLGAYLLNLVLFAQIMAQVLTGLLAIALTAVVFVATLTDQRSTAQRKREKDIKNTIRRNKRGLNIIIKSYLARVTGVEEDWRFPSVLKLYIVMNVDGQEDVESLIELLDKVAARFPTEIIKGQISNIQWLVQDSYTNYEHYARSGLELMLLADESVISNDDKDKLQALKEELESQDEYGGLYSLRQLLGRRALRVALYSIFAIVALTVSSSVQYDPLLLILRENGIAHTCLKATVIALSLGATILISRYLILLLQFLQNELFSTSSNIPYIYDPRVGDVQAAWPQQPLG